MGNFLHFRTMLKILVTLDADCIGSVGHLIGT